MKKDKRYSITLEQKQVEILKAIAVNTTHENRSLSDGIRELAKQLEEIDLICQKSKHENLDVKTIAQLLPMIVEWYLNLKEQAEDNFNTLSLKQLQGICKENPDYYKGWTKIRNKKQLIEFMRSRRSFVKVGGAWIV